MKNPNYRSLNIALCLALFASMTAFAQSEKIIFKTAPEPNQTVRTRMVWDTEADFSIENIESDTRLPAALPGPIKMIGRTVVVLTEKIGAPDKKGNITAETTFDEVSSEITMNGQPLQIPSTIDKSFVGKKIMVVFNKRGEIIDIKMPPALGRLKEEFFRQVWKSSHGNLPQIPIGIGEFAMAPMDLTVPIPIPGVPPVKIDYQMKSTLISVEKGANGRLAKLDHIADAKMVTDMEVPDPNGNIKMSVDLKMNARGNSVTNIDKGVAKSGYFKETYNGKIKMTSESREPKSLTINVQGTTKATMTGRLLPLRGL
ncbi:MAG: hypothetical protein L0220_33570 [Acidobacteria bacterium]|nr:hypothetical protein [Acidobacteriota bacterium]